MEVFDVFTGFGVDFNLSVKHDGNEVKIVFAPQTEPPCAPVNICIDKSEVIDAVELRTAIKQSMLELGEAFAPISEQIASMKRQSDHLTTKINSKVAEKAVVKALKDDKECSQHISAAKIAISKPKELVLMRKTRDEMNKFNKGTKAITTTLKKEFDDNYKKLVAIIDAAEPSLFGGPAEEDDLF